MNIRLIRLKEVMHVTGLARATIYKYMNEGTFPKSVSLGGRATAWEISEIEEWVLERIRERDEGIDGEAA
ncbi:AlpA family transcriptional regulator [Vibrio crassostreae]|nr:AlpA family transcriptional regulator [Vibrio crassostreae]TCT49700.1 AlpA family transcriptional regulator [Vibrio crassostreae]TCT74803.1 AlpA family transcriptional regulator [Vibrio crassostreae]TCT94583.1 AlpA family transcriptional regulator [Vibrio crassostreae]TWD37949.1 AlpA family transcriptional regulator [Vibrio crassostreae]CAK1701993.1 DNA-binding transcriptional activator AlpA [Vibrio crassostreae]